MLTGIAVYTLRYRKAPAVPTLLYFYAFTILLLLFNLLEITAASRSLTRVYSLAQYISYMYIPLAWVMFALRYTGIVKGQSRPRFVVLFLLPVLLYVTILLFNELLWPEISYYDYGNYSLLRPSHGPLYWIVFALNYSLIASGTLIMLSSFLRSRSGYYRQSFWFILGSLMPGLANLSYLGNALPGVQIDFTPIGFGFAGVFFFVAIYFHKMVWVLPITRSVILQEMEQPLLVLDTKGWVLDMNRKFEQMFGIDKIRIGTNSRLIEPLREFLDAIGYQPDSFAEGQMESSGRYQWEDRTFQWEVQTSGLANRAVIIQLSDITDKLHMEQQMFLIKDEFMKREKHASIGKLAAGVAHEINNPLAFMQSNFRSLKLMISNSELAANKDFQEIIESLSVGLERIGESVASLLNYTKSGKSSSKPEDFSLEDVCRRTLRFMQYELRNHCHIELDFQGSTEVHGFPNHMSQVIFNILINAMRAIEESGKSTAEGMVILRSRSENEEVCLEIENNGRPIDEEMAPHLFDMFFSTKASGWGSGLGLSVSKEIVEVQHKGRLELSSTNPVVFRICLPIRSSAAPKPETSSRPDIQS